MEPDITQILQEQLRDIHIPEAIGWWPLAVGWWILIALLLVMISLGFWQLIRYQKQNRYRHLALSELNSVYNQWRESEDTASYLQSANQILKRASSEAGFEIRTSALSGSQWIEFLNLSAKQALSEKTANALSEALYQKNPSVDVEALHADLSIWLRTHKTNLATNEINAVTANA